MNRTNRKSKCVIYIKTTQSTRRTGISFRALDGTTSTFYKELEDNFKIGEELVIISRSKYQKLIKEKRNV